MATCSGSLYSELELGRGGLRPEVAAGGDWQKALLALKHGMEEAWLFLGVKITIIIFTFFS